jgi:hypothetical protein
MKVKVAENSTEHLRLRMTTTAPWIMIFSGVAFALAGPLVVWLLGQVTVIAIQDEELVCRESLIGKFFHAETSTPIADISKVGTQVFNHVGPTLEVTVFARKTSYPIHLASLDGDKKIELAARIDQSLRSGTGFYYQSGMAMVWTSLALAALLTSVGFYCLACLQTSRIYADRSVNMLKIAISFWLLPITRRRDIEIDQIKNVEIRESTFRGRTTATSYRVVLHTQQSNPIALSSGPMFTEDSSEQVCHLLEMWLNQSKSKKRKRNPGGRRRKQD